MGKRLKECSKATDVDSASTTEPSQNESHDLEPQVIVKKQKKVEKYDCVYENKDAYGNNKRTIIVRGLDCSLSMDDMKRALRKHFGPCGYISRVFVPTKCKTGSLLGIAYIDVVSDDEGKKALLLDGSYMGSMKLEVISGRYRFQYPKCPNFQGCERCVSVFMQRLHSNFVRTHGGRVEPRTRSQEVKLIELHKKAKAKAEAKAKVEAKNHI